MSTIDGAYVKRREKLKNKISSKRRITVDTLNDKNQIHFKKTGKLIEKKVPSHSVAQALARNDLPVPGGPYSKIPLHG